MYVDVSDGDVRDTCFSIIPAQTSNADPVSWSTIHIVYVYIWASCLYWYAVISCTNYQHRRAYFSLWSHRTIYKSWHMLWMNNLILCRISSIHIMSDSMLVFCHEFFPAQGIMRPWYRVVLRGSSIRQTQIMWKWLEAVALVVNKDKSKFGVCLMQQKKVVLLCVDLKPNLIVFLAGDLGNDVSSNCSCYRRAWRIGCCHVLAD